MKKSTIIIAVAIIVISFAIMGMGESIVGYCSYCGEEFEVTDMIQMSGNNSTINICDGCMKHFR